MASVCPEPKRLTCVDGGVERRHHRDAQLEGEELAPEVVVGRRAHGRHPRPGAGVADQLDAVLDEGRRARAGRNVVGHRLVHDAATRPRCTRSGAGSWR